MCLLSFCQGRLLVLLCRGALRACCIHKEAEQQQHLLLLLLLPVPRPQLVVVVVAPALCLVREPPFSRGVSMCAFQLRLSNCTGEIVNHSTDYRSIERLEVLYAAGLLEFEPFSRNMSVYM